MIMCEAHVGTRPRIAVMALPYCILFDFGFLFAGIYLRESGCLKCTWACRNVLGSRVRLALIL